MITTFNSEEKERENEIMAITMLEQISAIVPKRIEITKTGNPVLKKIVTLDEDMTKIISFIKSIKIQGKSDKELKGWMYRILIICSYGEKHSVELGAVVYFDGIPYSIDDESDYNDFKQLYSSFNYDEVSPYK